MNEFGYEETDPYGVNVNTEEHNSTPFNYSNARPHWAGSFSPDKLLGTPEGMKKVCRNGP